MLPSSLRALSLYKQLLRSAALMPTPLRQKYVTSKTKVEFREHEHETNPERIKFLLDVADANLDDVVAQSGHLTMISKTQGYHNNNIWTLR